MLQNAHQIQTAEREIAESSCQERRKATAPGNEVLKVGEGEKVSEKHKQHANEAYNMAEAGRAETHTVATEGANKRFVAVRSTESEMQNGSNTQQRKKVAVNPENMLDSDEAQRATNEQSRVVEMTNIEASKRQRRQNALSPV